MPRASSGSFFSSPRWKRVFSRMPIDPGIIVVTARSACGPWQSSMKRTGRPVSSANGRTSRDRLMSGRFCPLGRPKCDSSSTIAPRSLSSAIVGTAARSLVSSLIAPSCIGTLKSTRTSTRLPVRSAGRSSRVLKPGHSAQLGHRRRGVDHAVRKAPFIVVPADHADQLAFEHRGLEAVDGRARRHYG